MTEIELDPDGVKSAVIALKDWSRVLGFNWSEGAERIVNAYLTQALRERPMSEAPEGEDVLWFSDVSPTILAYRLGDQLYQDETRKLASRPVADYRGWLPIPQSVKAQP